VPLYFGSHKIAKNTVTRLDSERIVQLAKTQNVAKTSIVRYRKCRVNERQVEAELEEFADAQPVVEEKISNSHLFCTSIP